MKTTRKTKEIVILLLICFLSAPCLQAWNDTGHMTVAELAWRNLSTSKRNAISTLLKQHPHYSLLLATNVPTDVDTNEWVFLKAATWPDMVRPSMDSAHPKPVEITKYHHAEWHYINLPYIWPADAGHLSATNFPAPATNVLWALTNAVNTLKDPHAAAADKAVSLCWVLHLLGDLHQPLHATMMFSDAYPKGDEGGNALAVAESGNKPTKLHAFWDDLLGGGSSYHFIDTVADSIANAPQYAPSNLKDYKNHTTWPSWAKESVAAAEAFSYLDGDLQFADWSDYDHDKIKATDVPVLTSSYVINANDVAKRRVSLAGKRLANLLKTLF
jgi:hypothetical protein